MPLVTFVSTDGERHSVEAEVGYSVAEAAVRNNVPGITMECGGGCACAGCHVIVKPEYSELFPAAEEMEADMLEFTDDTQATSRLSCQLIVELATDGLEVSTLHTNGTE